jgi:hypothetical protein
VVCILKKKEKNPVRRWATFFAFFFLMFVCLPAQAATDACEKVVKDLQATLPDSIDESELVEILRHLNQSSNSHLPEKFVTKAKARAKGWKPGRDLWSIAALRGASIGGDPFRNLEGRLPKNHSWREADLAYRGGKRNAKRLIFSADGKRYITVDHYRTFSEVPACR